MSPQPILQWSFLHRAGFRFVFVYFLLYTAPMPSKVWDSAVKWTGARAFGLYLTVQPNGSGDTTWNYVQVFFFAVTALIAMIIWSIADRRRPNYHRLHGFLHGWIRYVLGAALMSYGAAKLIKSQFPFPDITRLTESYGDSSPMGLLWTFMGYSLPYNAFTGFAEFLPGLLLFFRRTATLGALLGTAVLVNIVALNFCFDVPVKLFSMHLLLMAIFVFLPDVGRLWKMLVVHQPVPPREFAPLLPWRRIHLGWQAAKVLLLIAGLGFMTRMSLANYSAYGDNSPKPALYGSYRLTEYHQGKRETVVVLGDGQMWRELNLGRMFQANGMATVKTMDGDTKRMSYKMEESTITIGNTKYKFSIPQDNVLLLDDSTGVMRFVRTRVEDFLLMKRGFHWINEYPFNR